MKGGLAAVSLKDILLFIKYMIPLDIEHDLNSTPTFSTRLKCILDLFLREPKSMCDERLHIYPTA